MPSRTTSGLLAAAALALALPAVASSPQEPATKEAKAEGAAVEWKHEGLAKLPEALARAKQAGKRLLIGLSGGPG